MDDCVSKYSKVKLAITKTEKSEITMRKLPQKGDRWTREEFLVVFNLYFKLNYGQMDHRNKSVQHLAQIMGRSANSVAMRLNNFASCDPMLQKRGISGLSDHKKICQPYWDEFFDNKEVLAYESERILADYEGKTIKEKYKNILHDIPKELKGETRIREVKTRVNQNFFRQLVLANYDGKCALTGIDIKEFLVASHIVPWSENKNERLNPENGICLSSLLDKAFDRGYMSFDDNGRVLLSRSLRDNEDKDYYKKYFAPIEKMELITPKKYLPNEMFLAWHRKNIFRG